jgi:anaerobic selenocysteine-containing dehydrogenase
MIHESTIAPKQDHAVGGPSPTPEGGVWVDQLNRLLESTGEGIFGVDMRGQCTFVNRAAAEMLGYAASAVLGRNMHELIHHDWLDHEYLAQHTLGWDQMRARALQWPPERAAAVCGISPDQIRALAQAYGACRGDAGPAAIRLNYGMQRVRGGGNAVRLIAALPALIGAWRHRAGGMLLSSSGSFPVNRAALQRPDLLAGRRPRTINMSTIGDDLLRPASAEFGPAIEALVVYNSNPVAVAPDSGRVVQGFAREDLFTVVLEHFQTDTADYADYLLPATTQLEHWDVHAGYGHTDALLNRPAIEPLGQARTNTQIFRELAQRMGFTEPEFTENDQTLCRLAYGDAVDFEALLAKGFAPVTQVEAPFAQGQFPTPSGKCEFFSARLAAQGLDGARTCRAVTPNNLPVVIGSKPLPLHGRGAADPLNCRAVV